LNIFVIISEKNGNFEAKKSKAYFSQLSFIIFTTLKFGNIYEILKISKNFRIIQRLFNK